MFVIDLQFDQAVQFVVCTTSSDHTKLYFDLFITGQAVQGYTQPGQPGYGQPPGAPGQQQMYGPGQYQPAAAGR